MKSGGHSANVSLTIVVPARNSAATLDWTLASLCASPFIRVIVADSYSQDKTPEICARWNVETIDVPAGNMYSAINAGIRMATTDWVAWVNSDDWIFTAPYMAMLEKAFDSSVDVIYGGADYVDADGRFLFSHRPPSQRRAQRMLRAGTFPFCQPATIFRRSLFEKLKGLDERYRSASDFDFFLRASRTLARFQRFDKRPVAAFRLHPEQISTRFPGLGLSEKSTIRRESVSAPSGFDSLSVALWQLTSIPRYAAKLLRAWELSSGKKPASAPDDLK